MASPAWIDGEWETDDGLALAYREYPGGAGRPPLLCLHGLTRNARDFEELAARLAGDWRLIVPEMRGRGRSEYSKASASYALPTYVGDVVRLLEKLEPGPVALVGTSMGGLMAMVLAQTQGWPIVGALLNDIGPELEAEGLGRIREYVGQARSFETWMHAARALRDMVGEAHPDFTLADWLAMAKRTMCVSGSGRIAFDYDMKIAEPLTTDTTLENDLWPAYRALGGKPLLVLRGELSDLLSTATLERMMAETPGATAVTVPRVGHPPLLDEPVAKEAIDRWLGQLA